MMMTSTPSELLTAFLTSREDVCKAASIQTYRYTLAPYIEGLGNDGAITPDTIRSYLAAQRERGVAEESQRNSFRLIKTMCRWAVDEDLLGRDPFVGRGRVKLPPRPRRYVETYTEADIVALLTASKYQSPNKRRPDLTRQRFLADGPCAREDIQSRALVVLLVDSALRISEVCSLSCGVLHKPVALVKGKGDHELPFFMSDSTRALLEQLVIGRPDDAPLFRNWDGVRPQARDLRTLLTRLARRAAVTLPPRPLHAFRHYAARQWKAAGLSDLVIMDLMRHSSIATTRIYTGAPDVVNLTLQHAKASSIARLLGESGL